MNAVELAKDILRMHDKILDLEHEVAQLEEYKDKYERLLGGTLENNKRMAGNILKLMLEGQLTPKSN